MTLEERELNKQEYQKQYYIKNEEKLKENMKIRSHNHYIKNKDKIDARHKEYSINNKDRINEQQKGSSTLNLISLSSFR